MDCAFRKLFSVLKKKQSFREIMIIDKKLTVPVLLEFSNPHFFIESDKKSRHE